jgi:hypothetical protein
VGYPYCVEYWNPRDRAPDFVTLREHDRPAMPSQSRARLPIVKGDHDRPGVFIWPYRSQSLSSWLLLSASRSRTCGVSSRCSNIMLKTRYSTIKMEK